MASFRDAVIRGYGGGLIFGSRTVGLSDGSIGLSLGGPGGDPINSIRDLGPRIGHQLLTIAGKGRSDWIDGWVPVVAPIVIGVAGALLYGVPFPR